MVLAADAVKQGMVDRVATLDQVLTKLGVGQNGQGLAPAAAAAPPRLRADEGDDDPDEDDICECPCDACRAGDCEGCTNAQCADADCGHEPRAGQAKQAFHAAIAQKRRELELI
jgi:hypothetical protein